MDWVLILSTAPVAMGVESFARKRASLTDELPQLMTRISMGDGASVAQGARSGNLDITNFPLSVASMQKLRDEIAGGVGAATGREHGTDACDVIAQSDQRGFVAGVGTGLAEADGGTE